METSATEIRRHCPNCGILKQLQAFAKDASRKDGRQCYCRACCAIKQKGRWQRWDRDKRDKHTANVNAYRIAHPEINRKSAGSYYWKNRERILAKLKEQYHTDPLKTKTISRHRRANQRRSVFALLGDSCACCGEADFHFLTLDHIHGKGRKHFTERGTWGVLVDVRGDPEAKKKYQLLCANCNMAKARYGACPHQAPTQKSA